MRLPRKRVPIAVRLKVAERQCVERFGVARLAINISDSRNLDVLLAALFPGKCKVELHHRPALVNRRRYVRNGKTFYDPPEHDPDHLVYLLDDEHDVETRVRGQHGQHSDLALARKRKRKERKAKRRRKHRWPKGRKLRSRNTLKRT